MGALVPFHSSLGGSKAEIFINCPGSVDMLRAAGKEEDPADEPDYRRDGTAAHAVASECLKEGRDVWEYVTDPRFPFFDKGHVEAVQSYIDGIKALIMHLSERFPGKELHTSVELWMPPDDEYPEFCGSLDYLVQVDDLAVIIDYKHGTGIIVEAENNKQLLYYALKLLRARPEIRKFLLVIHQPRAFSTKGPYREWEVSAEAVREWGERVLFPAMASAGKDLSLVPGTHCRFCPARLGCPALDAMAQAAAGAEPAVVPTLSNEALGRAFELSKPAEMYFKAVAVEVYKRAMRGEEGPWKLVKKRADRAWEPGFTPPLAEPKPMSPKQVEDAFGKDGKKMTAEHAYSPDNGYTVATASDRRHAVIPTAIPEKYLALSDQEE